MLLEEDTPLDEGAAADSQEETDTTANDKKENKDKKSKKKDSSSKKDKNITSFKTDIAKSFSEFAEKKLQTTGPMNLKNIEEIFANYESEFYQHLRQQGKGHLLQKFKEHLGKDISLKDIGKVKIKGDTILNNYRRDVFYASLDREKNQVYYEMLVENYGKGCEATLGLGAGKKWKDFIRAQGCAVSRADFASEKDVKSKKQLEQGQVVWSEDSYKQLMLAFQRFCGEDGANITREQQEEIVKHGDITNAGFIKKLKDEKLYSKEFADIYVKGISYGKKNHVKSKQALDKEIDTFWKFQDTILRMDVEENIHEYAARLVKIRNTENSMLRNAGMTSSLFTAYPIEKFRKAKKHENIGSRRTEQITEMSFIQDALNYGVRQDQPITPAIKKELLIRKTELQKEVGSTDGIDHTDAFVADYLDRIEEEAGDDTQTKELVRIFRKYSSRLSGLTGKTSLDGKRDGANKTDTVKLMRYLAGLNAKKHLGAMRPSMIEHLAKQYGFKGYEASYQKFIEDIYDPSLMTVELPPLNGATPKLRFAKKSLAVSTSNLPDILMGDTDFTEVFDVDIELLGIDGVSLEELELVKIEAFPTIKTKKDKETGEDIMYKITSGKEKFTRFSSKEKGQKDITLKTQTEYEVHDIIENKAIGPYVFMTLSRNERSEGLDTPAQPKHVLVPTSLAKQYKNETLGDESTNFLLEHTKVIHLTNKNIHQWQFARTQGMNLDDEEAMMMINLLYQEHERTRATFVKDMKISADALKTYNNPNTVDFKKYLEEDLGGGIAVSDTRSEQGAAPEIPESDYRKNYFEHIGFADEAPDPEESEYVFRNEGDIVAWLKGGKVMIHAGNLQTKFGFLFVRDEKENIVHPPRFEPDGKKIVDDGYGPRGVRAMFGNYMFNEATGIRKRDIEKEVWNDARKNDAGQTFLTYLTSLVAHEKAHRFLEWGDIRKIDITANRGGKEEVIEVSQELLSEIAEWFVSPKQLGSIIQQKTGIDGDIRNILIGESLFRVVDVNKNTDIIKIQKKDNPSVFYELGLSELEATIWSQLIDTAEAAGEIAKGEKLETLKAYYEEKTKKRDSYTGTFFDFIRELDAKVIAKSMSDEKIENFVGYLDIAKQEGNLFRDSSGKDTLFAAASEPSAGDSSVGTTETRASSDTNSTTTTADVVNTGAVATGAEKTVSLGKLERIGAIELGDADPNTWYVFGDNLKNYGKAIHDRVSEERWPSLDVLQGGKLAPVRTMRDHNNYLFDHRIQECREYIDEDIARIRLLLRNGENVVIRYSNEDRRWLVGRNVANAGAPQLYNYIQSELDTLREEYQAGEVKAPIVNPPPLPGNPAAHVLPKTPDATSEGLEDVSSKTESPEQEGTRDRASVFKDIKGHTGLDIDSKPAIMFRVQDSKLQGFGSVWLKGKLTKNSSGGYDIILQDSSEGSLAAHGIESDRIHLSSPQDLELLYKKTREGMYKFKDLNNREDFFKYISHEGSGNDGSGMLGKGNLKWTDQYMKRDGSKIVKQYDYNEEQRTDEWTYIGKAMDRGQHMGHPDDSVLEFYRIQQHDNHVVVEAVTGDYKFKQSMSWTTFMIFMTEKGMHPYTEKEYEAQRDETHIQLRGATTSFWDHFMSINTVIAAFKKFPEAFKYKMEQNQKFEASKLYEQLATTLLPGTNLFNLNDIKADAVSELDTNIMQVIEGYKERLSRSEGDNKGVHGNRACERIEEEIFLNIRHDQAYKHRAAGYLAWLAENEGNIYARNLSAYAGSGMWVRVLLGKRHQEEFLKWRKNKHDELRNQGFEDEEKYHDYVMMELLFLQERCDDTKYVKKLYGSRFPKKIEQAIEVMGSESRLKRVREGVDAKGSIYAIVNEADSKLKKLQPSKAYATLENLAERCEEPHHYHALYKVLMQTMISGVGSYTFSNTLKGKIKQIGRTFGIPFCLMIKDIHHPWKATRIIDNIALNHNVPTLTSFIKKQEGLRDWNAKDQTESNYSIDFKHHKVIDAISQWRSKYGYLAMDSLNNMDEHMLNIANKKDAQTTSETKKALETYENKMFDAERNTKTVVNDDAFKAVLNPTFKNGILNFQKPAFKRLMQSSKGYDGQMDSDAREMRKHLTRKVNTYGQGLSGLKYSEDPSSKGVYEKKFSILFKKFCEYFKEDFKAERREQIRKYFMDGKIIENKNDPNTVWGVFKDELFSRSMSDGAAQDGLRAFLETFDEHKTLLTDNHGLVEYFDVKL